MRNKGSKRLYKGQTTCHPLIGLDCTSAVAIIIQTIRGNDGKDCGAMWHLLIGADIIMTPKQLYSGVLMMSYILRRLHRVSALCPAYPGRHFPKFLRRSTSLAPCLHR